MRENNAETIIDNDTGTFADSYNEKSLFKKILKYGKKAGMQLVFAVLVLFYAVKSDKMPLKEKGYVIAALGYFIFPYDLIPDFIPVIGYGDDIAVLYMTIRKVSQYIDDPVVKNAKFRLRSIFGEVNEEDLDVVIKLL